MLETVAEGSEHESETSQRISGWGESLTPPPPIEDEFVEDFGAIRSAETTCVENLTWALLHLKKTIGKKDERATWQGNRDAVDRAMESIGVKWDEIVNKKVASNIDDAVEDYKQTARRLKSARNIFRELADEFDEQLNLLELHMQPRLVARGIEQLPDEILTIVLELVDDVTPEMLAAVCRRFRQLAVRIPSLWKAVSPHMHEEHLHTRLQRSGHVGLHINFFADEAHHKSPQFEALLSHSHRWQSFSASFCKYGRNFPLIRGSSKPWTPLYLPMINHLQLRYGDYDSLPFAESTTVSCRSVPSTWSMPKLQSIEIVNFIPLPFSIPSLKLCTIILSSIEDYNLVTKTQFKAISAILAASPGLETFTLNIGPSVRVDMAASRHEPVHLNKLTTLVLGLTVLSPYREEEFSVVQEFINSLRAPGLSRLQIRLSEKWQSGNLTDMLRSLLSARRDCTKLRWVGISISINQQWHSLSLLDIIDNLPHAEEIVIEGRMEEFDWPSLDDMLGRPPCALRRFVLKGHVSLKCCTVPDLLVLFTKSSTSSFTFPRFEKLVIQECPCLAPAVLRKAGMEDRINKNFVEWVD